MQSIATIFKRMQTINIKYRISGVPVKYLYFAGRWTMKNT